MTKTCTVSGSPCMNLSNIRDCLLLDLLMDDPFCFNVLGILAGTGTDLGLAFVCSWQKGATRAAEVRQEQMLPRKATSSTCPAPCLLQFMLFISTWGVFPIPFHFIQFFFSSPSHTCNCFPSGTAHPKDVVHLLPPFLNLPVQELTSGTVLSRLTSDLSAPRADPEPKTGIRDLLIFIASWLEMRSPKEQTPTIPSLLYSLKSYPSFATSQLLLPCVDALPSSLQLLVQKPREEQLLTAFCSFTAN